MNVFVGFSCYLLIYTLCFPYSIWMIMLFLSLSMRRIQMPSETDRGVDYFSTEKPVTTPDNTG